MSSRKDRDEGAGGAVWNQPGFNQHGGGDQDENGDEGEGESKKWVSKSATDVQRARLNRLMAQPDKPIHMPQQRKAKDPNKAPEFVYNVMGSSAGAGSGEFHVYRQIRRKEMLRQRVLGGEREKDELNEAYHMKLKDNERRAEERTAKKREKRNRKKEKKKEAAKRRKKEGSNKNKKNEESSSSSSESEEEEEETSAKEQEEANKEDTVEASEKTEESQETKDGDE